MFRIGLLLAFASCCFAEDMKVVQVEATLQTGSQSGKEIPVNLVYDADAVSPEGDCVVPAKPAGEGLTSLESAQLAFHDAMLTSVRLFLRMEQATSPIHNLVIGVAGPDTLSYVDQNGGIGGGTYRVRALPNSDALRVIRTLPQPLRLNPEAHPLVNPTGQPGGLVIMAPELPGSNPLNIVRPPAAPGLVVTDPAPLSLGVRPPPLE
jgi:hypothetical protein